MVYEKQGKPQYFRGWTVKQAKHWIKKRFRKVLSGERVRQLFHELGRVRRKPGYVYVYANRVKQEEFLQNLVQLLLRPAVLNQEQRVLFVDEATLREHPTRTSVWTLKGVRPQVPTTGGHQKIHIFGAMDWFSGKIRYKFYSRLNSANVIDFLTYLHAQFPTNRIRLIWDNARPHTSRATHQFGRAASAWLEMGHFPKYRPKLNPIEQLWSWLRDRVTHNRYYAAFRALLREIKPFLRNVQRHPPEVLKRCKMNYS